MNHVSRRGATRQSSLPNPSLIQPHDDLHTAVIPHSS
jgi:hypothetical protein